ncbi:MAG: acyltransferase [Cyanobacteria bacterium J06635_1]
MQKLISVEYLRAFSMLYIVGYWHLFNYTDAFPDYKNRFTYGLMLVVMGLFVFMSGFLIGCTTKSSTGLIHFYKKRLIRIYPLYALAVIVFYFYGISAASTLFKSLFFISMYNGPAPYTLWFITMLMLFYLVAPFLVRAVEEPAKYFLLVGAMFLVNLALMFVVKNMDHRILLYFPCFCTGIYYAKYGLQARKINIVPALILFCFGLILSGVEIDSLVLNGIKYIPLVLSCSYLIFAISLINEDKFKRFKLISLFSYSSFAMYLFHRPVYVTLKALYFPEGEYFQALYLTTVGLLMVTLVSWGLQKLYDTGYAVVHKTS